MRKIKVFTVFAISFALGACSSSGFNRGSLEAQLGVKKPVISDDQIREILNKKPNLPKPFKLAVYFKPETGSYFDVNRSGAKPKWRWSESDRNLINDAATELKNDKSISQVFPLLPNLVEGDSLRDVRIAAAKTGADAVLIIDGAGQVDRYLADWGWTYFFVLPALFVKGTQTDVLFMTSAAMWDVRNEYLYLTAEAEGVSHEKASPIGGEKDETLYDRAKVEALTSLKNQIVKMARAK